MNGATVYADVVPQSTLDEIAAELALSDGAVTEAILAAGAVTETKIADGAVSSPKIVAGAVQAGHIAAGSIDAGKLTAGAVTADKIAALAVTADKIAANAITADKLDANAINGKTITGATLTAAGSDGSYVRVYTDTSKNTAAVDLQPPTAAGAGLLPASLRASVDPVSGQVSAALSGPHTSGQSAPALHLTPGRRVTVAGDTVHTVATSAASVRLGASGNFLVRHDIPDSSGDLFRVDVLTGDTVIYGGLKVAGRDVGRGKVASAQATGNSAAVFAETSVLSIPSLTFVAGRAYRVRIGGAFTMTAAGVVRARLRDRTSTFTVEWADLGHFPATLANNPFRLEATAYLRRTAATDLTAQTLALTLQASVAGTVHAASATAPRWVEIEDCGEAADFPQAVTV
ncbi:hypothetical protein KBX37_10125 [Micromonospora sp. U56]|uniref:hypothetical protein n=1 Tax=Micromonospora sp. U56 TaxID=2824900 RepID=UPI001B367770|nr:hypothetical protein [Micromonospora sp. U56]MBQ0893447.1 hypothetical protein [Micromonospora sp. U56]